MAKNKTLANTAPVAGLIAMIKPPGRKEEALLLVKLLADASGEPPVLWGKDLIGFGRYTYHYASGHSGEWFRIGFSPRAKELSIYIMPGLEQFAGMLARIGQHRTGKSCLYVKNLAAIDIGVLAEIAKASLVEMAERYPPS